METCNASLTMAVIELLVELPQEPAVYAVTIKLVNQGDGQCHPNWVARGSMSWAGIEAKMLTITNGQYPNSVSIPLTSLPDLTGFVGVIGANPAESAPGSEDGMRRQTSKIRINVDATRGGPIAALPILRRHHYHASVARRKSVSKEVSRA